MRNFLFNKQTVVQKGITTIVSFLLFMCTTLAYGQGGAVTGIVTDSNGEPLIGVNVLIKGTMTGDITNIDGRFTIPQAPAQGVLVFSYVGYTSQEINFSGSQRTINARLSEDSQGLEEVIVVGYGTRKAGEMTGAVATIKGEEILKLASVTQSEALRNIPGVTVTQSNTPGSDATVRVRGLGTINNAGPLYVVDGVPNATANPNDIETITVLKDAAAQAIYGTRAANGVILITTRQGRRGERVNITANMRLGISQMGKSYPFLNAKEYGEMLWLQAANAGIKNYSHPIYGNGPTPDIPEYLFPLRAKHEDVDYSKYSFLTVEEGGPGLYQIVKSNPEGTDWLKEISRTGITQDYQIGVNGGSDRTVYSFSFNFMDNQGMFYWTGFKRMSVRSNITTDVNKYLKIGQNININYEDQYGMVGSDNSENSAVAFAYRNQPILPVYDVMGNFVGAGSVPGGAQGNGRSPMELLWNQRENHRYTMRIMGVVHAELTPFPGLKIRTQASKNYTPYWFRNINYVVKTYTERSRYDSVTMTHRVDDQWTWTNTADYLKQMGLHTVKLMAGTEAIDRSRVQTTADRTEFLSKDPNYMWLSAGIQNQTNGSEVWSWSLFSVFGNINYNYDSKYLLDIVVRRDGSSRFAAGYRYGTFYAFSGGWVLSREKFMAPVRTLFDNLKLRAGWGVTGNDQMAGTAGYYNSYTTFDFSTDGGTGSFYSIGGALNSQGQLGFRPARYGVSDVRWEQTAQTNVAIEGALRAGLTFSVDVWYRKTNDMLYNQNIPRTAGVYTSTPSVNIGEMENRGFDITLGYRGTALNRELRYNLSANISQYKNKILSLGPNPDEFIGGGGFRSITYTRAMSGTAYPEFYGYIVDGIFQTQAEADAWPRAFGRTGTYNRPGFFKYRDFNGDGIVDSNDRTWIGSPHPKLSGGFDFSFEYKGFDVNGQFYGTYGNKLANDAMRWLDFTQYEGARSKKRLYESWGSPHLNGDNSKAKHIIAVADDSASQTESTHFLEDGSYLRLRNLQVGYNIKPLIRSFNEISALRLYVQMQNLLTFTKYSGLNPETNLSGDNAGVDSGAWPTPKNVMIGLTIGF